MLPVFYSLSRQPPGSRDCIGAVCVALGWTHGGLLRPSGESWPYTGIKAPGAGKGDAAYDTAKSLLREASARYPWTKSSASGWVWWNYLPLEASETDLDATRCVRSKASWTRGRHWTRRSTDADSGHCGRHRRASPVTCQDQRRISGAGRWNVPMARPRSRNLETDLGDIAVRQARTRRSEFWTTRSGQMKAGRAR